MTFRLADLPERMQNKIAVENDCWIWTGAKNNRGYGSVTNGKGGTMLAHRRAYTFARGEILPGLEIDHLCEQTACVNPAHLEAVTREEHRRRITHRDLVPVYRAPNVASPEMRAAFAAMLDRFKAGAARYHAMSLEERAEDDARRHRLHVATGTRCVCEREAA